MQPFHRHKTGAAALFLLMLSPGAHAGLDFDFEIQPGATQEDFESVAEDVAALLNSKTLTPAEPMGLTGFGIGVYASYLETESAGAWQRVTGEDIDEIGMVGVVAQKGLPLGIDVGASYAWVPESDVEMLGAEIRYALLEGGVATPAIGLRGSYSKLDGVDEVDFDSYGIEIAISKGFGPLTPYAGVGQVWSELKPDSAFGLDKEKIDDTRFFVGLRLSALIGLTPEYERIGDRDVFNLRFGFAF
ncbi:MAG: hypothetical protein K0Q76_2478 [Panacagrimonas sp.]|nr:hypothetical protein [Panacagrimonas sp.]MCC2657370.1 hypothetical protein [Panacagrimonas sp.]